MKDHGVDLADLSLGFNTDDMNEQPFKTLGFMVERGARLRRQIDIPVGISWNLGEPQLANRIVEDGSADLVFLGRPALANPHWPVWAARELGHPEPFSLLPQDWSYWLQNRGGHEDAVGWPKTDLFEGESPGVQTEPHRDLRLSAEASPRLKGD